MGRVTPMECALIKRMIWYRSLGYEFDINDNLFPITYKEELSPLNGNRYEDLAKTFLAYDIGKLFNISFIDFMDLPQHKANIILSSAEEHQKRLTELMPKMGDEEDNSNTLKKTYNGVTIFQ